MRLNQIDKEDLNGLGSLEILAKQIVEGFITGLHKSPFHGFSVEFAEHTLYNNGDSIKNIDWKLFAKTDKMFVKRFEEETNLRCQLVIDASSSMFFPDDKLNKFEFSVLASAAIINLLKRQRDAFGLSVFAETLEVHTTAKSTIVHEKLIYHELEKYLKQQEKNKKTNLIDSLHQIAESIHKRGMVVIFSDFFENYKSKMDLEEIFSALQHIKYNKHEIIIFNVLNKNLELDFNFENRPYHFVDSETGESLKLNPKHIADAYKQEISDFKELLDAKCAQLKIDLVNAYIEDGFNETLKSWLIKRSKMV